MGYRSDVKYVIVFPSVEKRDEFLVKQKMLGDRYIQQAVNQLEVLEDKPVVRFHADGWKWYESYPEVRAHIVLCDIAAETYGAAWRFVRIGEDDEDIDVEQHDADDMRGMIDPWELLHLVRSSVFNDP